VEIPLDEIRQRFRECGVRLTPQRMAIYRALANTTSHPTAEELYRTVKRVQPMMSQNTVYYTLGTLREAGLVHEVNYWHDRSRFDANMALHHHLICLGCRKIQDLWDGTLDSLALSAHQGEGFAVTGHRVEFHGYCASCGNRQPGKTLNDRVRHRHNHKSV
jgi:Fur family peroxide stress response transcriptional regulator